VVDALRKVKANKGAQQQARKRDAWETRHVSAHADKMAAVEAANCSRRSMLQRRYQERARLQGMCNAADGSRGADAIFRAGT
jgi:hypothetical protein